MNTNNSKDIKNLSHAQDALPEELQEVKAWWIAHGNLVTIILLVLLVAVLGYKQLRSWKTERKAAAMEQFSNALTSENSAAELEKMIAENKVENLTQLAKLRLASVHYAAQDYELSAAAYREFAEASPTHPLAPIAKIGVAHCDEALGNLDEAIEGYEAVADEYADSFLRQDAVIGKARCLILKGTEESKAQAKSILDEFLASEATENANSAWAAKADEILHAIDRLKQPAPKTAPDLESFLNTEAAPAVPAVEAPAAPAAEAPAAEPAA